MVVAVADPRRGHLDQYLARPGLFEADILYGERFSNFVQNGGFHAMAPLPASGRLGQTRDLGEGPVDLLLGQLVVLESTTFPGTTDEVLKPILEEGSGLIAGEDFYL
ncbi:MAG: hypothetical protein QGH70_07895, partial [Nitrospinota bacterium]|nr:hypothetical protein [Nitrospinota bacterium]